MAIDLTKHYPQGTPEYWEKLAVKRQDMIDRLHRKNRYLEATIRSTTEEKTK